MIRYPGFNIPDAMLYSQFSYILFNWEKPKCTPNEKIGIGKEVAMRGVEEMVKRFKREKQNAARAAMVPKQKGHPLMGLLFFGGLLAAFVLIGPAGWAMLAAIASFGGAITFFVLIAYYVSLAITTARFRRWLLHCETIYRRSLITRIISCGSCGCRMRVPGEFRKIYVRCPGCGCQFSYFGGFGEFGARPVLA